MLPGVLVFLLLVLDPPPAGTAHWIMRAYAPLMLWALMRKIRQDGHLLAIYRRTGHWPVKPRVREIATQAALIGLLALFVIAPTP
jgi:hypothetical protein